MNKYQEALSSVRFTMNLRMKPKYAAESEEENLDILQELVDKATPMKPYLEGSGCSDGHIVYDTWFCPNCNTSYEMEYQEYKCCPECEQAIDWSTDEGEL